MPARKQKQNKTSRPLADKIFYLVTILMPCIMAASFVFSMFQMRQLEEGILDVCATQQDAYVDLVLSQINLRDNRTSAEIINDILGTLDASSNKYWTFSSQQTMLFVKDVLETNKYKGFNASSYYSSESADAFFQNLQLNRVTHTTIVIAEKKYIASGVSFEYQNRPYKLCLLTNRNVLLDNNSFLEAKSQLWTMLFLLLAVLVIVPMSMAILLKSMQRKEEQSEAVIRRLNDSLSEMNQRLSRKDLFDTRSNLWSDKAFPQFVQELSTRADTGTVTMMRLHSSSPEAKARFLSMAHFTLDQRVIRFESQELDLILLFLGFDADTATLHVIPLLTTDTIILRTIQVGKDGFNDPVSAANALLDTSAAARAIPFGR